MVLGSSLWLLVVLIDYSLFMVVLGVVLVIHVDSWWFLVVIDCSWWFFVVLCGFWWLLVVLGAF